MTNQREIGITKLVVGLAAVVLISVAGAGADMPARLSAVKVTTRDDGTGVAVTTGVLPKYHASLIDPRRLVIDFENTQYEWKTTPVGGSAEPIKEIRGSQFRKGVARLVVHLSRAATY